MVRKSIILAFLFLFLGVTPVLAVSLTISEVPQTINDQPFSFNVSITDAGAGTNYLRVDLYKEGTTNYFGETYNGNDWYSGSDGKQYFPITIISGQTWEGSVQGRIGNPTPGEYPGPGNYKLRVRRYTASGGQGTTDQTPQAIQIVFDTPTPTPTPSPTPSPSPTPTPTKTPTPTTTPKPSPTPKKSPSPTNTPTPTSTPNPTPKNTPFPETSKKISYQVASVAAVNVSATPESKVNIKSQKQTNPVIWLGVIFIFAGVGLLGYIYIKKNAKIHFPLRR